jgi:type II secretory pathway component PulF
MAVFRYQAVLATEAVLGRRLQGTVTAESPRHARDALRAQGLKVLSITPTGVLRRGLALRWRLGRRHQTAVVSFVSELATLLSAGIPLLQSIDAILRQQRGAWRVSLLQIREQIATGTSLADALRKQPHIFDDLCVTMVGVGEQSGRLDVVLEELASFKQRSSRLVNRIATAMIYPAIVMMTAVAVMLFLMTFVVPQLIDALLESGQTLPWPTRVVYGTSQIIVHQGWIIALVLLALGATTAWIIQRPKVKLEVHRRLLLLPGVRKQALVRIAFTLGTLLRSGVTFLSAIRIAAQSTSNLALRDALRRCEEAVGNGRDLGPALQQTGAFPETVVQIFAVGQQSGRLDQMLDRLAADYDRQVQAATERLLAMLEPALILILAVVIGIIVLSVILPYLEAGNVL